jgi:hypothetical protein
MEDQMVWETVLGHEDYQICTTYPHQIRKKDNHRIIAEHEHKSGYIRCSLNGQPYEKHRLVAIQFIPNIDGLDQVDHINHDKTNYHLSNLRWISSSNNCRNKSSHRGVTYTFVNEISPEAIHVTEYNKYEFSDLYYHENVFYYFNGVQYRKLHINEKQNGSLSVNISDTNHHVVTIYYSKFKREYDLI